MKIEVRIPEVWVRSLVVDVPDDLSRNEALEYAEEAMLEALSNDEDLFFEYSHTLEMYGIEMTS